MRRIGIIIGTIVLIMALGIGAVIVVAYVKEGKNENILANLMNDFSEKISTVSGADIVEMQGTYGKLNGNGNGISYFGAALLRKNSISDIEMLKETLDEDFEIIEVQVQQDRKIHSRHLEHRSLQFDTDISKDGPYICISFYTTHPDSDLEDLLGH